MALKGDTSNLLLADIFQTLSQNRQTGILKLRGANLERRILFAAMGITLWDATAFRAPKLGHLLVAANKAPAERIDATLQEIDREGPNQHSAVALLATLDDKGLLSIEEGVRILRTEVLEELYDLFLVGEDLEFEFQDDDQPCESIPRECFFRVEEVVMEAARRLDDNLRMAETLDREEYYALTTEAPETDPVANLLDGSNTLLDIAERLAQSRFQVARWVFGLSQDGKIRPATRDELIGAARSLDPASHRLKVTRLCLRALRGMDDGDARLNDISDMLIRAGSSREAISVLLRQVKVHLDHGNAETAYTLLMQARELNPNHLGILRMLADMHHDRREKAEEIKVLTTLAERSAAEQQFDNAVEYSARVAELFPDSPLLDNSFLLYCQKAERHNFGADVLMKAAAGRRHNPTRAALLYNGVLLLDPSRNDVKKLLARQNQGRRKTNVVWLGTILLFLPVTAVVGHQTMKRMQAARFMGRYESAERLLSSNEPRLALDQLLSLKSGDLDQSMQNSVRELRARIEAQLRTIEQTERSSREDLARGLLSEVQRAIDDNDFAAAVTRIHEGLGQTTTPDDKRRLAQKLPILLERVLNRQRELDLLARQFEMPRKDVELAAVNERFAAPFSTEQEAAWVALRRALVTAPKDGEWQKTAPELLRVTDAALDLMGAMRPGLAEIGSRLSRIEALNVLSADYQEILDAEERGDFGFATRAYERLIHSYGDGSLRTYLDGRRKETARIDAALSEVATLLKRGDILGANQRAWTVAKETGEYDLLKCVGIPLRISTLPPGAMLKTSDDVLGVAPQIFHARRSPTEIIAEAPGFAATARTIVAAADGATEAEIVLQLQRESSFTTPLGTRVQATPGAIEDRLLICGRDGVVYRLDLATGKPAARYETGSLNGITARPLISGDIVVASTGEGDLFGLDSRSLTPRWTRRLDDTLVGEPVLANERIYLVLRGGRVVEIDPRNGEPRTVATTNRTPTCGPVVIDGIIAVGTSDGTVVALDHRDGHTVFETKERPQPVAALADGGGQFIAALDSGRIVALEPRRGTETWHMECGNSLAAPPRSFGARIVVAAGNDTLVLDPKNGAIRQRFTATDWVAATPTVAGERLYVGDRSGALTAFDLTTGETLFRHVLDGALLASPLVVRQSLVLITATGLVTAIGS